MPPFVRILIDRSEGRKLDYSVPEKLRGRVEIGSRVIVMMRNRRAVGTVLELLDHTEIPGIRAFESLVGEETTLPPVMMLLADWMADYYCAPIAAVMRSMLPPMMRGEKIAGKKVRMVSLKRTPQIEELSRIGKSAPKQRRILEELMRVSVPVASKQLMERANASESSLKGLLKNDLVDIHEERRAAVLMERTGEEILPGKIPNLNEDQKSVVATLEQSLDQLEVTREATAPYLLHGVTGSGKTEVYLRALARALKMGKSGLVLVPEIALTPQTVERFRSRFDYAGQSGAGVAVLHSHLTDAERREEWMRIQRGEARIVIGARSAVFAPLRNLGIIIVDEEHENTYKQEETPRYHARDVAVMRGRLEKALVILGSATPSVESFRNVQRGKYILLELPRRADGQLMPLIRVVDLRLQGKRAKSDGGLSAPLQMAITKRLEVGQQTILFLNRRGYSTALLCEQCGHVCRCPNCSLSLTLHRNDNRLSCHLCGHGSKPPDRCPECRDPGIQHSGIGTQRVEETIRRLFPKARLARMDADTMTRRGAYADVLGKFRARQIDILLGTQMIAKGLDFPNVTLVGIINADIGLHSPDFRAGERTFQLLTQVAGRAGRGETEGEVIIQTFSPASPSIQHARHHDYKGFYEQEISFREAFRHPPFSRMILIQVRGISLGLTSCAAVQIAKTLHANAPSSVEVSEAAPAPLERAHGQYRYHVILKGKSGVTLAGVVRDTTSKLKLSDGIVMTVDVDPYSLL